ncbi:MAG: S41 family peptidase [Anaerolineae bacterium]|nr:S41 family peptidase [Anaerolineae bacterium]
MLVHKSGDDSPPAPAKRLASPLRTQLLFAAALIAGVAFIGGVWFADRMDSPHNTDEFDLFWQSWTILEDEYYYELPADQALIYGAAQGLLSAAGDRYTFFAPPQAAAYDRQTLAGEFGGIGAYVGLDADGQLTITALFSGFPAKEAGLLAQDVIEEVDGVSIAGWTLEAAVGRLRGKVGSQVTLAVYRPADSSRFTVTITRARVELPTVITDTLGSFGYVRLYTFNDRATELLEAEIETLIEQGVTGLILDLRGNPGGLLDQAVSVSDLFLDEGVIVTQQDRKGRRSTYRSQAGQIAEDIPLVVLIDGGSASASEVVAGALQDRGRAALIGQPSFGKGSVQHVHDLPGGSQVHVTVALWFTPDETPIQDQGLIPDVAVDDSAAAEDDPFIAAALAYLTQSADSAEPEAQALE